MAIDRGILVDLTISSSTYATKRNEEEQHAVYDITTNDNFSQQNFTLEANNVGQNNPQSVEEIGPIESFIYIYSPYEAEVTLTKDDTSITLVMVNLLVLSAAFDNISIKNTSVTDPLSVKVIAS